MYLVTLDACIGRKVLNLASRLYCCCYFDQLLHIMGGGFQLFHSTFQEGREVEQLNIVEVIVSSFPRGVDGEVLW